VDRYADSKPEEGDISAKGPGPQRRSGGTPLGGTSHARVRVLLSLLLKRRVSFTRPHEDRHGRRFVARRFTAVRTTCQHPNPIARSSIVKVAAKASDGGSPKSETIVLLGQEGHDKPPTTHRKGRSESGRMIATRTDLSERSGSGPSALDSADWMLFLKNC
jgi:hypothetical protein